MPFLLAIKRCVAASHLWSGILLRSYNVPTVTVNGARQALHWYRPGRCDLPFISVASPITPHLGQIGPSGQRRASSHLRALVSLWKIGFEKSLIGVSPVDTLYMAIVPYYVKVIIAPISAMGPDCVKRSLNSDFRVSLLDGLVTNLKVADGGGPRKLVQ